MQLNKKIEKVFELASFMNMVKNVDRNPKFDNLKSTSLFMKQSEKIQKQI